MIASYRYIVGAAVFHGGIKDIRRLIAVQNTIAVVIGITVFAFAAVIVVAGCGEKHKQTE